MARHLCQSGDNSAVRVVVVFFDIFDFNFKCAYSRNTLHF